MGTDINISKLKTKRLDLSQDIIKTLKSWDQTVEDAIDIMASTEVELEKMKEVREALRQSNKNQEIYDEDYEKNLKEIISMQNEIIKSLDRGKKDILESLNELGKSKKVRNNYVSKNSRSIFINKDI